MLARKQGPFAEIDTVDVVVEARDAELPGHLSRPGDPVGLVIFAHGSGSSRNSPRNRSVARALNDFGLATLLFDLLTPAEAGQRENVFDMTLLAGRLIDATEWARNQESLSGLPIGYFGASTGAGAALRAASRISGVSAIVSRGGRPDMANKRIPLVESPTLLIVGGEDGVVEALNREAQEHMKCENELVIVPGAGHLFEEPGALEEVARLAASWFVRHMESEGEREVGDE